MPRLTLAEVQNWIELHLEECGGRGTDSTCETVDLAQALLESQEALRDIALGNSVPNDRLEMQPAAFHKWFGGYLQGIARKALLPSGE